MGGFCVARCARTLAYALFLGASFASAPALAGSTNETLTLDVTGYISPACSIALPPIHNVGELSRAGQAAIPFTLDCNQPLSFEVHSEQGGLRHESIDDYIVRYRARLELLDDAAAVGREIASEDMYASPAIDRLSDATPFDENGRLVVRWDDTAQTIAQGTYRDVVTITLVLDGP